MAKNVIDKVIRDYDGRPLKAGEKVALFPYNPDIDYVPNKENICTVYQHGMRFLACKKAVPEEYVSTANAQFTDWQEEVLPNRRDGRCLIPQPDGTLKECPRKRGNNHCSCAECPDRDKYERKNKSFIGLDNAQDEYELAFATIPSAEDEVFTQNDKDESKNYLISTVEAMLARSPKHAYAMLLEALGYKGDAFAAKMKMTKPGANYVRKQVKDLAPAGVTSLTQINFEQLKANHSKDDEYYRREARKALKVVISMFY